MSLILVLSLIVILTLLFSQFGGKLVARSAVTWWLVFGFILFCVSFPYLLEPITHFLGIQLVSNFVLASLILFLFMYSIQESSLLAKVYRKQRDLVSTLAADQIRNQINPGRRVLVFFPCYNEEENLPALLENIQRLEIEHPNYFQFCIINDGSNDDSARILQNQTVTSAVHHVTNIGVSGVLQTAFKISLSNQFSHSVQVDSDGQHPIHMVPSLLQEAITHNIDLVVGSRFINGRNGEQTESTTRLRSLGSLLISLSFKFFSLKARITDPTSGFRVYSRNAMKTLLRDLPDEYPEPESIAVLISKKLSIKETAVRMLPRQGGISSLNGIKGLYFMIKVSTALIGLRLRTTLKA